MQGLVTIMCRFGSRSDPLFNSKSKILPLWIVLNFNSVHGRTNGTITPDNNMDFCSNSRIFCLVTASLGALSLILLLIYCYIYYYKIKARPKKKPQDPQNIGHHVLLDADQQILDVTRRIHPFFVFKNRPAMQQ